MEDINDLIKSLGSLHDSVLRKLVWRPADNSLDLEMDDLYANFFGLPEYQGPKKGVFIFSEVAHFEVQINLTVTGLMVYDWRLAKSDAGKYKSEILFSPAGRMIIECGQIECVKDPSLRSNLHN